MIKNLESKRFGKLLVIKKIGKKWECICDCGRQYFSEAKYLVSIRAASCGCIKRPDLIGKKFNKLTVLRKMGLDRSGRRTWECQCDCGKLKTVSTSRLLALRVKSCGCQKRKDAIARQWKGCGEISGTFWGRIVNNAKNRNIPINIGVKDGWNLFLKQNRQCALTGLPLEFSNEKNQLFSSASLDRINSDIGYIKSNIQWVHKDVNLMKMSLDEKRLVELCQRVTERAALSKA